MKINRVYILSIFIFIIFTSATFASKKREVINAFGSGTPAKMDIEITKVKSTNYLDFYIDRSEKKIFRDITQKTHEIEDFNKKLYVTTYLKPSLKTNTIHDELEHKIITLNNKRYLEISYSDEPEKIYLWVTDKNKVEKLYTGILKEILNAKAVIDSKRLELWYSYIVNESFLLEIGTNESIVPNNYLKWYRGEITKAWNTPEKHINYKISIDNEIPVEGKTPASTSNFSVTLGNALSIYHENIPNGNGYKFLLTPKVEFEKITLYYKTAANQGNNTPYYEDTIIIYGKKNNLYFEKTDMDFGTFSKTEGKTATANINAFNTTGYDYTLVIPETTTLKTLENDEIEVKLNLELDNTQNNIHYNKIIGTIPEPTFEYKEGSYSGTIPVTVTITPNKKGGRF